MAVKEIGDPRLQALFGTTDPRDAGVRPTLRLPRKGLPPAAIAVLALIFAIILFTLLNARRMQSAQPSVGARPGDNPGSAWTEPPPLYVPPVQQPTYPVQPEPQQPPAPAVMPAPAAAPTARSVPVPAPAPQVAPQVIIAPAAPPAAPQHASSGAPLVIDSGEATASGAGAISVRVAPSSTSGGQAIQRVRASALANRSMTVPQGYLIPAVLETGFDSTKPGFARAIVSRDVRGFDGKNVLIPRGSRLIGEYQSSAQPGQKRAIITWTRLLRPDGMTITMQSPAVDTMGRGGVAASVNTHFFARLGDALLQTTFQIGQALAGRAISGPVVVLPGNVVGTGTQLASTSNNYTPTLKVAPGTSISIFVAQDLDFGAAAAAR